MPFSRRLAFFDTIFLLLFASCWRLLVEKKSGNHTYTHRPHWWLVRCQNLRPVHSCRQLTCLFTQFIRLIHFISFARLLNVRVYDHLSPMNGQPVTTANHKMLILL